MTMEARTLDSGVLVLGANGFVGRALIGHLLDLGVRVHALSRSRPGLSHGRLEWIRGSIEDAALLREVLPHCGVLVHTATATTPGRSARDPGLEITGNLMPLARLLECARDSPGRRLVYLSSAGAVYGASGRDAIESTPLRPLSFYGAGKAAAEALLHGAVSTCDWEVVVLRPTNLYGPGQLAGSGFAVVPTLFQRSLDGQAFQVWGDGSGVRDYCFISDMIDIMLKAMTRPLDERVSVFNVATGHHANVLQLIAATEEITKRKIQVQFVAPREFDVPHVFPSRGLVRRTFGWEPRYALREGLGITWEWFQRMWELGQHPPL